MQPDILGMGRADSAGLVGSGGLAVSWNDLGTKPGGTAKTFRTLFGMEHTNFRRLDRAARLLHMACEATGLSSLIPDSERQDTALVIETELGCLQTDQDFATSLETGVADSNAFPYTLPNTCLGELAIHYGLRGPTLCLSVESEQDGVALTEAVHLLEMGDARYVVVGRFECLDVPVAGWQPQALALVAVLAVESGDTALSRSSSAEKALWPESDSPSFSWLAEQVSRVCPK